METKTMNTLYCVLSKSEFNIISSCKNDRDIWHALEITHEGTSQVKETNIDMLEHLQDLFKILPNKFIISMFTRMTTITNSMDALGTFFR